MNTAIAIVESAKKELPEDVIFQDREHYTDPLMTFKETFDPRKRQMALGKLINNFSKILPTDPADEVKRKAILRYFIVLVDAQKYHLDYRACRGDLLHRYKDLVGMI